MLPALFKTPLVRNAYSLVASIGLTSVFGLTYWILAARFYSVEEVGLNAALISTMTVLSGLAQLNLGSVLTRYLPSAEINAPRWILSSYALAAVAALLCSLVFFLGAHVWTPSLRFVTEQLPLAIWFVLATVLWTVFALQDGVLAGLRRAFWVPVENTFFAIAKIVLLVAFAKTDLRGFGIFASWTVPLLALVIPVNLLIFKGILRWAPRLPRPEKANIDRREVARFLGGDFAGTLFFYAATGIAPILVLEKAGAAANAKYYLAWTITYSLYLVAKSIGISLTAEGAADTGSLRKLERQALLHTMLMLIGAVLVVVLAAPLLLDLFGSAYADGTVPLRILAVSALPFGITTIFLSAARVEGRMGYVAAVQGVMMILVLGLGAPLLKTLGATGMSLAWLITQTLLALVLVPLRYEAVSRRDRREARVPASPSHADAGEAGAGRKLSWSKGIRSFAALNGQKELVLSVAPLLAAMVIWASCLHTIDPITLNDWGLPSALRPQFWLCMPLLSAGFFFSLRPGSSSRLLPYLYLAALAVVLHATSAIDYETLRYPWAWRHLGIVDYIARHGGIDRGTASFNNIYHNWPGLFAATVMAADLLGVHDIADAARWAPLVSNLAYAGALLMLFRQFTTDNRLVLGGVWIFLAGNWIGQDYYSPQALAFFFYLTLLAVCLRFLSRLPEPKRGSWGPMRTIAEVSRWSARDAPEPVWLPHGAARTAVVLTMLLLIFAIAATHPLTPVVTLSALAALTVLGRLSPAILLVAAAVFLGWDMLVAAPFLQSLDLGELGRLTLNMRASFSDASSMSAGQATVAWMARGLTMTIMALGLVGGITRLASGKPDGAAAALTLAPLPLMVGTAYGGEVMFRVYLFALPFLAFFAAAAIFTTENVKLSAGRYIIAALLGAALPVAFVFANNGKDQAYVASPQEIAALRWLYDTAPPRSLIMEGNTTYPGKFSNYEDFDYLSLADEPDDSRAEIMADPADVLATWASDPRYAAAYIVLTRSQESAYVEPSQSGIPFDVSHIERALAASTKFRVAFSNRDARIFTVSRSEEARK